MFDNLINSWSKDLSNLYWQKRDWSDITTWSKNFWTMIWSWNWLQHLPPPLPKKCFKGSPTYSYLSSLPSSPPLCTEISSPLRLWDPTTSSCPSFSPLPPPRSCAPPPPRNSTGPWSRSRDQPVQLPSYSRFSLFVQVECLAQLTLNQIVWYQFVTCQLGSTIYYKNVARN